MKRNAIFLCVLLVITSVLIIKWTTLKSDVKIYKESEQYVNNIQQKKYVNDEKNSIALLLTDEDRVVTMNLNEYLLGVVPAEMPPTFEIEALKAQAVVARTYALEKRNTMSHEKGEICSNYAHCQAYLSHEKLIKAWKNKGYTEEEIQYYEEKVKEAVYSTTGIVITYNGEYIKAYFHSNSGGKTEDVSAIWGKQNIPYLKSVESKGEEESTSYKSQNIFTISEIISKLKIEEVDVNEKNIGILSYTKSGRVNNVRIGNNIYSAEKLRSVLGLRSTNFTIKIEYNKVVFDVLGYGHGVGMSQNGANAMAKDNKTYEEIIKHYYQGVVLSKVNTT